MSRTTRARARSLLFAAATLSFLVAATAMPTYGYDPGRPTSNKNPQPPGGGNPPPPSSQRKVALGVGRPDGRSAAAVDAFTASVGGQKPAMWVIWSSWGWEATREFPTQLAEALRSRNIAPMIWWEPWDPRAPGNSTYPRHRNIVAGNHDAYIRGFARDARDFGGTVLLRFAHEPNSTYFPWSVSAFDNSATTFIAAWRHIHDIFRQEGANNVRFVWSVAKEKCTGGCNPYATIYPGDAYVDVMAFSGYNWGAYGDKSWQSMYQTYQLVTAKLAQVSSKPLIVAETGSNSEGGDKPAWIRDGYREVYASLPQIEAIVYLDADLRGVGHPDWSLISPLGALAAYAEIAALPQFDTRSPFGARKKADLKAKVKAETKKTTRRAQRSSSTEQDARDRKKAPRVRQGTQVEPSPKDPADTKAARTPNRKTKPKNDEDEGPPAVLDTFSR